MTNIPWDILIGGTALLLSIIGIYYTYRSVRSPILLEARKKHTAELIEVLKEWYDKFPLYESATDPKTISTPSILGDLDKPWHDFPDIERDWKYQDLIQSHLPNEYKTLPLKWEEYKKAVNEYGETRSQLYEKIKKDVVSEVSLKYGPSWNLDQNHIISANFVESIYTQCVLWVKSGRLYADETWGYKREGKNELWFGSGALAKGAEEELVQAEGIFKKMMFEGGYLTKYKTDILKIIKMEKGLESMYKEMKEMLEKLMGYPFLPGTKCEVLKNI